MSDNTASPTTPTPVAKPGRRWPVILLGLCLVAGAAGGLGWFMTKPKAPPMALALEKLGVSRPDGLIEAHSLSQLPKDLLAVPFLKATLTEDFVFYYEAHADRLGLIGSLRRIISSMTSSCRTA